MGHSNVSPSGAERFFACPGCVQAQAAIDIIEPSNPAALEGSAIHELAADCLKKDIDPYDMIGETVEVKDNYGDIIEFTVNDDFAFAVRMYRNTILGILKEHGLDQNAYRSRQSLLFQKLTVKLEGPPTAHSWHQTRCTYSISKVAGVLLSVRKRINSACTTRCARTWTRRCLFPG